MHGGDGGGERGGVGGVGFGFGVGVGSKRLIARLRDYVVA